jgi:signal transduction histidine kinase
VGFSSARRNSPTLGTVNNVLNIHCGGNLHLGPVDLTGCMQSGVEFVQADCGAGGRDLSFHGGEDKLRFMGNENLLRQIILNLACNAIRHTPPGEDRSLDARGYRAWKDARLVEVTDTGCGMEPQMLDRIFEAGFSASGDTPGLGLAVCKRLMISHGGEIRVSSKVNQGTTFQLEFPTL